MQSTLTLALVALLAPAVDQDPEWAPPDPAECTICGNEPERLEEAHAVAHEGFRFGESDTRIVQRLFKGIPLRFVEGPNVKLCIADVTYELWWGGGDGLGSSPEAPSDGVKILRELANGALAYQPYHKAHVYLDRCEAIYARICEILQVQPEDFPSLDEYGDPIQPTHKRGQYMGEGPWLGQAAKFEVMLLPSEEHFWAYMNDARGLDAARTAIHLVPSTNAVALTLHQMDGALWDDDEFHGYIAHYLALAMLDSYRHHSYPNPPWLRAGVAHLLEREVIRDANNFDGQHPSTAEARTLRDWTAEAKKLAAKRKFTPLAQLMERQVMSELTLTDHVTSWSMVRFLTTEHADAFAGIARDIRGITRGKQPVDAMVLTRAHRDAFARHMGLTYEEFDDAWRKWAKKQKKAA